MLSRIPLRTRIILALTLWFVAEAATFAFVVDRVGVGGALLLGLVTSVGGARLLKQAGTSALATLRGGAGFRPLRGGTALEPTLAGLGALLLLLPGFLSDAIGLGLAVPATRRWIVRWIEGGGARAVRGQPRAQHGPSVIDLGPEDWRTVEDKTRRP